MRIFGAITISVILAEMLRYVKTLVKNRKKEENTRLIVHEKHELYATIDPKEI